MEPEVELEAIVEEVEPEAEVERRLLDVVVVVLLAPEDEKSTNAPMRTITITTTVATTTGVETPRLVRMARRALEFYISIRLALS